MLYKIEDLNDGNGIQGNRVTFLCKNQEILRNSFFPRK